MMRPETRAAMRQRVHTIRMYLDPTKQERPTEFLDRAIAREIISLHRMIPMKLIAAIGEEDRERLAQAREEDDGQA